MKLDVRVSIGVDGKRRYLLLQPFYLPYQVPTYTYPIYVQTRCLLSLFDEEGSCFLFEKRDFIKF